MDQRYHTRIHASAACEPKKKPFHKLENIFSIIRVLDIRFVLDCFVDLGSNSTFEHFSDMLRPNIIRNGLEYMKDLFCLP
jgi:hypothetical protein